MPDWAPKLPYLACATLWCCGLALVVDMQPPASGGNEAAGPFASDAARLLQMEAMGNGQLGQAWLTNVIEREASGRLKLHCLCEIIFMPNELQKVSLGV